jgi:hypothetical protein
MKIYTSKNCVLGARCGKGHGGNRRLFWDRRSRYAECLGCGTFFSIETLPRFQTREDAIRADRAFRARWPEDPAADVLAGRRV